MTLVDLMRHGLPVGGRRYRGRIDDPLSEEGWRQMWDCVGHVAPWDVVVSSPLRRCAEFARALAARRNLPLEIEQGFREISFGEWEGRHVRDILADTPEQVEAYWQDPVAATPPGGEPLEAFRDRLVTAWQAVTARHTGRHLLIIGHGGLIRTLVAHHLGMPLASVLRLEVPNAGVTRLRLQQDLNGEPAPSLVFHARIRL
jgi:alpha-ribazole phosphatase/probable phosphoglycerate mutase